MVDDRKWNESPLDDGELMIQTWWAGLQEIVMKEIDARSITDIANILAMSSSIPILHLVACDETSSSTHQAFMEVVNVYCGPSGHMSRLDRLSRYICGYNIVEFISDMIWSPSWRNSDT